MNDKIIWKLEKRKIKDLIFFDKNPRLLTRKQKKDLTNSLDEFGLIDKPTINLDNQIIGGHQRIRLLQERGVVEVECWVPNVLLNDIQVALLCLRLNKNSGSWDYEMIANQWDCQLLLEAGFEAKDFEDAIEKLPVNPKVTLVFDSKDDLDKSLSIIESFENCKVKVKL